MKGEKGGFEGEKNTIPIPSDSNNYLLTESHHLVCKNECMGCWVKGMGFECGHVCMFMFAVIFVCLVQIWVRKCVIHLCRFAKHRKFEEISARGHFMSSYSWTSKCDRTHSWGGAWFWAWLLNEIEFNEGVKPNQSQTQSAIVRGSNSGLNRGVTKWDFTDPRQGRVLKNEFPGG